MSAVTSARRSESRAAGARAQHASTEASNCWFAAKCTWPGTTLGSTRRLSWRSPAMARRPTPWRTPTPQ